VIILDTDVLSIVQRANGPGYEKLADRLDSADDDVAVSIVSFEVEFRCASQLFVRFRGPFMQLQMPNHQAPSFERPGDDIGHWNLVIHWSLRHWPLVISQDTLNADTLMTVSILTVALLALK